MDNTSHPMRDALAAPSATSWFTYGVWRRGSAGPSFLLLSGWTTSCAPSKPPNTSVQYIVYNTNTQFNSIILPVYARFFWSYLVTAALHCTYLLIYYCLLLILLHCCFCTMLFLLLNVKFAQALRCCNPADFHTVGLFYLPDQICLHVHLSTKSTTLISYKESGGWAVRESG